MHFFNANLASTFGIEESIFLQNLYFLLKGRLLAENVDSNLIVSITMSRTRIREFQEYFSYAVIRRITKNLLDLNIIETVQKNKRVSNSLTYSFTLKGWILMMALEKKCDRKIFNKSIVNFNNTLLSECTEHLLKIAEDLSKLTDVLLISTELDAKLADIIIEYRNLIEKNRTIEKIKGSVDSEVSFFDSLNFDIQNQVEEIISENSIFKKRVEKSFSTAKNFYNKVVLPTIEKYGYSKVLEALKKCVEEFLPSNSPVANFYTNLTKLNV
ncbi:MAG: hypothetical protein ACRCXX_05300 [Cetobacterium sp.]|uniref:hypothetical protein n=1 Tax=Cetobacterium sp. TaxID=2071632 RepID=UPI003F38F9B8